MAIPDAIKNRPTLLRGSEFIYEAFWRLSTCREIGFAMGPIPWQATAEYCDRTGVDDGLRELIYSAIAEMDNVYRRYHSKENASKEKS